MRVLYVDIDSQRPDHLGCYGYHRNTSPNIDRLAAEGLVFHNCYTPDAPCLPSRTALFSGRAGIHTGVIDHGGVHATPFNDGPARSFRGQWLESSWMMRLRYAGMTTATVSPFGERHGGMHWYAGFNEILNTGKGGMESAEEVSPVALDWLQRRGREDNWFLHVNFWDPHTPYRVPADYGDPFKDEPIPSWYTEAVRAEHWTRPGPHSAQEVCGWSEKAWGTQFDRQPAQIRGMDDARRVFDGYDTGTLYADDHLGRLLNQLADLGVLDETIVVISADHGENLGELNIYGDHQIADQITSRVPLVVRWPGMPTGERHGLLYNYDFAATLVEMAGGEIRANWDGVSFAHALKQGEDWGRDSLVVSQGAWSCMRAVRWEDSILIRSYHDGYHGFPDVMLYDLANDPHEQHDLAESQPARANEGLALLERWHTQMMRTAEHPVDPMWAVMHAGGAFHTRGHHESYCQRLRETNRAGWAEHFERKYAYSFR